MSKIHVLDENVCNRIAAGEVVERPASVVKELVENSLDAGALKIRVEIEKGGTRLIRVTDNGEGMDPDDVMLCMETHATSKITTEDDIFSIRSFGFRGEAMPSIASVSRMTVCSRRRELQEGCELVVAGGKMISQTPAGCAPGTEIAVRELFYNVPARRKFLKSPATEERHIVECVTNIALAHPDISFELKIDGRAAISSPAAPDLRPRIRDLFGKDFASALLDVSKNEFGISVSGYIAKRSCTRASRSDQRIFVNGRPIESGAISRAIREGCGPTLEKGRFQPAILFLALQPGAVDVNVHPTKREVRFRQEFDVIAAVRSAVTAALRAGDQVIPYDASAIAADGAGQGLYADFSPDNGTEGTQTKVFPNLGGMISAIPADSRSLDQILEDAHIHYVLSAQRKQPELPIDDPAANDPEQCQEACLPPLLKSVPDAVAPGALFPEEPEEENDEFRLEREEARKTEFVSQGMNILGVMENSYIVGTVPGGLVLIDQHAAHERVLYEQILNGVDGSLSQKLLLPITMELSKADLLFISKSKDLFEEIGFELEPFGSNTLKINAIPAALPQDNAGGIIRDMLSRLADAGAAKRFVTAHIARAACKAAVKAHDKLTMEEARELIRQMGKCALPFSCPHGRPTVLNISLSEIEHRFGRK